MSWTLTNTTTANRGVRAYRMSRFSSGLPSLGSPPANPDATSSTDVSGLYTMTAPSDEDYAVALLSPDGTTVARWIIHAHPSVVSGGGGGAPATVGNESTGAVLVNATSPGDGGGVADNFDGTALGAAWNVLGSPVSLAVAHSVLGIVPGAANFNAALRPFTPSGAFKVSARIKKSKGNHGCGLIVRDSATSAPANTGEAMFVWFTDTSGQLYSIDGGVTSAALGNVTNPFPDAADWIWLTLARDASNNWTAWMSSDRANLLQIGTHTKTLAVAALGPYCQQGNYAANAQLYSYDCVDVEA